MHMQTSEISAALSGHFPHLSHVSFKKEKMVNDLSVNHSPVALNILDDCILSYRVVSWRVVDRTCASAAPWCPLWDCVGLSEQRRQVTFTSVWWVLLVCSVCTIFLHSGANTTPLGIRCSACVCVFFCQGSGTGWGESGCGLKTLCLFILGRVGGGATKLWNYEAISVCTNWWFVPLFHFDRFERAH